jgi:uncharacterized delta-60 repeat protein
MKTRTRAKGPRRHLLGALAVLLMAPGEPANAGSDPLDTTFGGDGITSLPPNSAFVRTTDVAVQGGGKTVVVGIYRVDGGSDEFGVARYNFDGSLDASFGDGGLVHTSIGSSYSRASAVAIQSDGKIVVVGTTERDLTLRIDPTVFAIARYRPDGSLDPTFDGDGKATVRVSDFSLANDVAIQSDGKIIVVGDDLNLSNIPIIPDPNEYRNYADFAIIRLNTNGSLDTTFNGDGKVTVGFGDDEFCKSVAIDYSGTAATNPHYGKIILAGAHLSDFNHKVALVRLTTKGNLDSTFGPDATGKVLASFDDFGPFDRAESIIVHPDGGYLVAGFTYESFFLGQRDFLLARYDANGVLDGSFGPSGQGYIEIHFPGSSGDWATDVVPSGDGGFFVGGITQETSESREQLIALAKVNASGVLDEAFGGDGRVITQADSALPRQSSTVELARGPGQRFVAAGGADCTVARYHEAGTNIVTMGTFNPDMYEEGLEGTAFIVGRTEVLPVPLRVFLSIGGSATLDLDYTIEDLSRGPYYVEIPAGQSFATFVVDLFNDVLAEGTESADFRILPDPSYQLANLSSMVIEIHDNDAAVIQALEASYVNGGKFADINYGDDWQLKVQQAASPDNTRETYLKFDLSGITTINSAKLRLYAQLSDDLKLSVAVNIYDTTNTSWGELTITDSNKPTVGNTLRGSFTVTGMTARWYEVDLTALLKAAIAAGRTTVTLVLRGPSNSASTVLLNSNEAEYNLPELTIN